VRLGLSEEQAAELALIFEEAQMLREGERAREIAPTIDSGLPDGPGVVRKQAPHHDRGFLSKNS